MSNEPVKPRLSELSQYVTRGEEAVRVDIYENGEGGWILEIIDRYNNSTVWDDPFPSDQSALDEAIRAINADGIAAYVGPPSIEIG
jgi:hypothetical protein